MLARLGWIDAGAGELSSVSVRAWIEREIRDPMARNLFYALIRTGTFTQALDLHSIGPALRQIQRTFRKNAVLYVQGGWQSIVEQLREIAVRAGATLMHSTGVAAIKHDGEVRRLRLSNGEVMEVGRVISAVPLAETCRLIRDADRTSLRVRQDQARPVPVACLDLCLKRLPAPRRNLVLGIDEPVFFTNQSKVVPSLAENGSWVMHVLKYNGVGEIDPQKDEALLERIMDLIQPGWRKEVVARQFLPNMTAAFDYMHIDRKDPKPGPAVPEIRGLYVAGEWASHGEVLVDSAAASGRRAAQRLLQDLRAEGGRNVRRETFAADGRDVRKQALV